MLSIEILDQGTSINDSCQSCNFTDVGTALIFYEIIGNRKPCPAPEKTDNRISDIKICMLTLLVITLYVVVVNEASKSLKNYKDPSPGKLDQPDINSKKDKESNPRNKL